MKITTNIEIVTPEVASKYLEKNSVNRKIRPSNVNQMCEFLENGSFMLTHQGIAFSDDGVLLDGQHRLLAIVKTGISAQMLVTRGLDKSTFSALDGGSARTIVDRTNLDKKTAQVTRFLLEYAYSGTCINKDAKSNMNLGEAGITDLSNELEIYCSSNVRTYSKVQIRAAAIILVLNGHDKDYVFNLYKNLVLLRFTELPPIVHSLIRQAEYFNKGGRDFVAFAKTLKAFDKKNASNPRLSVTDQEMESAKSLLKTTVRKLMEN